MVNLGNSHLFRFGPFDADFVQENPICCFHPPDSADFVRKLILYKRLRRIFAILSGKSRDNLVVSWSLAEYGQAERPCSGFFKDRPIGET